MKWMRFGWVKPLRESWRVLCMRVCVLCFVCLMREGAPCEALKMMAMALSGGVDRNDERRRGRRRKGEAWEKKQGRMNTNPWSRSRSRTQSKAQQQQQVRTQRAYRGGRSGWWAGCFCDDVRVAPSAERTRWTGVWGWCAAAIWLGLEPATFFFF